MQYFPIPLERWLKSTGHSPWLANDLDNHSSRHSNVDGWNIQAFGNPACNPLGGDWPAGAVCASKPHHPSEEVWLILPPPTALLQTEQLLQNDGDFELSISKTGWDVFQKILNPQATLSPSASPTQLAELAPELTPFCEPIPMALIPSTALSDPPWMAWHPGQWELLAQVLERLGQPPSPIFEDWKRQLALWNVVPSDSKLEDHLPDLAHRLLVSKSGLLLPLQELKPSVPSRVGGIAKPNMAKPNTTAKPSMAKPTSAKPTSAKPTSAKLWIGLALPAILLGSVALGWLPRPRSRSQSEPQIATGLSMSAAQERMRVEPISQHEELELARTELSDSQEHSAMLVEQPMSIDTLVRESLELNVSLASALMPAQQAQDPQPDQKAEDLPALAQAEPEQEPTKLVVSQSFQKKEFRVGRGFSTKKAKGIFTLNLDKGLEDKLHINGALAQELVGESTGQWRISMDDLEAELVLLVQSKPASRWQVAYSVQIPSQAGGPRLPLEPKDPEMVLRRLGQYDVWLRSTVDQWRFSAPGTAGAGQASSAQTARMYAARKKETERAITRWRQIEQLAVVVFDSVSIQVDLQPEPPDAPEMLDK
ncbi:MAG: hypothetical protein ACOYKN_15180 [Pirellula sp.]